MNSIHAPLSDEEFAALKEISKGLMQRIIPDAAKNRLIELGLIKQVLGGLLITPEGQMRLARGK